MRLVPLIAILSWFLGGILLGMIEVITLPSDPTYSTLLQLLPLVFLLVGAWFIVSQYQMLRVQLDRTSSRLKTVMGVGWVAVFGVDAGVASLNNIATVIFHTQLPYYYQGVSFAQKIIALMGIFTLGTVSGLLLKKNRESPNKLRAQYSSDFWEKPLTNIGFIALLLGLVLGLAQYWSPIVFAGFILLLAGAMLYPIGRITEKKIEPPDNDAGLTAEHLNRSFRFSIRRRISLFL